MTKQKALEVLLAYVAIHGREPIVDCVICTHSSNGNLE